MEALGDTSTVRKLSGPWGGLKPTLLLRFITVFGLLRDYSCLQEQVSVSTELTLLLPFGHVTKTYQRNVLVTNVTLGPTLLHL